MKVQSDVGCPSLLWIANRRAAAQLCSWRLREVKRELFYGSLAVAKLLPLKLRRPCQGQSCSDRLITALVDIKMGHPQKWDAFVWRKRWWCHISFDGALLRPVFLPLFFGSLELFTISSAIRDILLTLRRWSGGSLGIFLDSSDGLVKKYTMHWRSSSFSLYSFVAQCYCSAHKCMMVKEPQIRNSIWNWNGFLAAFWLRQSFPLGVSRNDL